MRPNWDGGWQWCLFFLCAGCDCRHIKSTSWPLQKHLWAFFLFLFFAPSVLNSHPFFLNLPLCGCRKEHIKWSLSVFRLGVDHAESLKNGTAHGNCLIIMDTMITLDNNDHRKRNDQSNLLIRLWNVLMMVLLSFNVPLMVHRRPPSVAGPWTLCKTKQSPWRSSFK